jgi:RNA polymerase sigma-54 factor
VQLQRPAFIQEQRLRMSPQIYQSIKLLELPVVDLREKIEEEIERNPALEVLEDRTTVSLDEADRPLKEEDDYFDPGSDSTFTGRRGDEAADEQRRFIEGALSRPETLQGHLLWQLHLEPVDDELRLICETLIQNLDEDGFHKEPVDLLFRDFPGGPPPPERIALGQKLVQSLDPAGTCTADYHESLKVQVGLLPGAPPGIAEALDHLELLERGRFAEAAKKLNRTEDEARLFFSLIRKLSPFPGRSFASQDVRFVVPDLQVVKKEGDFAIILNDEEIPVLGISPFFMKIAEGPKKSGGMARDFVRENIKEARWFIQSVNQRNHTLLRVARAIVEFQRPFFVNGPKFLAPLTLRDIARELGVHETTVSRIANGKYMQTEWGIFEVRHFFTNSISGAGSAGSRYSKEGVKEIIREMITLEDRRLSSQEIAGRLAKQGISLARRTVAKYRHELEAGSSYTR